MRINVDKGTPSAVEEFKFLGLQFIRVIPDKKWVESKQVIKQIDCNKCYCFQILQRLIGHLNFVIPFTTYSNHVLQPLYSAVINKNRDMI